MSDFKSNFWDERYSSEEYVYGMEPNQFFKQVLDKIPFPGKLLLPGEGEGRNAFYAAEMGWHVDAFDQSSTGKLKALRLAEANNVAINYSNVDLAKFTPQKSYYDCSAIIFVHFNSEVRSLFYKKIIDSLSDPARAIRRRWYKRVQQAASRIGDPGMARKKESTIDALRGQAQEKLKHLG